MPKRHRTAAPLDCLVIGGGPAGLTVALYLARFGRRIAVADAGDSRAARIPATHNLPMFPWGVSGRALLGTMHRHLRRYRVTAIPAAVESLARRRGAFEARLSAGRRVSARTVALCTGAVDVELPVPGVESAVRDGQIRYCPICDGPEVAFRRIGVVGFNAHAPREALFIARTYSRDVTLLTAGRRSRISPALSAKLRRSRVRVDRRRVESIGFSRRTGTRVRFADGTAENFDTLYTALGLRVRSSLATRLGAACTADGKLRVGAHQETTVPGLYAAGGVVQGLDQILIAMGHAAVAATAIHNRLQSPVARIR